MTQATPLSASGFTAKSTWQQHRIATTDGASLVAYTCGDKHKQPLVLVHGYPDNHSVWLPVTPFLLDDFFVLLYDVRGAGASAKLKQVSRYKIEQLADDLWSVCTQVLGDTPFHLVGHDWGSIQSWEAATQARFKGRMLSFTSMSGPCLDYVAVSLRAPLDKPVEKLKQAFSSWYIYLFHIPKLAEFVWRRMLQSQQVREKHPQPVQLDDAMHGMKLYRANFLNKQLRSKARRAICPVHLVVFEHDEFVTPVLFEGLGKWVDELTVSKLPFKHWGFYRKPKQLADTITAYFRGTNYN